ncbi:uncharacterized protein A4U43_C07F20630 [Asparagus officinalis]|uniref:Uncharacterized protein n=1 Tax=Asparagus officinalis TaxID=4686 RepID=A0A5P1EDI7_ASPOF|nr:uncharacterized protein A4U43_C07F20630 [Asparagus officinalis]
MRRAVLGSHRIQSRAVDQFRLPQDEKYLEDVPDIGLHHCLRSYLIRGSLVENELYNWMERLYTAYHKLLEEVNSLRTDKEAGSEQAAGMVVLSATDVDKLR